MASHRGRVSVLLAVWAMATSTAAQAELVIDQPLMSGAFQVNHHGPMGQSFTALASNLQSIGVELHNFNIRDEWLSDRVLTMTVFGGEGFEGPVLGTSAVDVAALLGDAPGARGLVNFGFAGLALAPGQRYTFSLADPTPRYGLSIAVGSNPYGGGRSFYNPHLDEPDASAIQAQTDLRFNVAAVVPEPGRLALLLCGLATLVALQRRRPRSR